MVMYICCMSVLILENLKIYQSLLKNMKHLKHEYIWKVSNEQKFWNPTIFLLQDKP